MQCLFINITTNVAQHSFFIVLQFGGSCPHWVYSRVWLRGGGRMSTVLQSVLHPLRLKQSLTLSGKQREASQSKLRAHLCHKGLMAEEMPCLSAGHVSFLTVLRRFNGSALPHNPAAFPWTLFRTATAYSLLFLLFSEAFIYFHPADKLSLLMIGFVHSTPHLFSPPLSVLHRQEQLLNNYRTEARSRA